MELLYSTTISNMLQLTAIEINKKIIKQEGCLKEKEAEDLGI